MVSMLKPGAGRVVGEGGCRAVVAHANQPLDREAIFEHVATTGLSKYDMPEFILPLAEMPLTASGKIIKRELVRWVEEGRAHPVAMRLLNADEVTK